jgi:hypothetical protein
LYTSYGEPGYAGFSGERQSAISDLDRAVDRIKQLLKEPAQSALDKGDFDKRRKKR